MRKQNWPELLAVFIEQRHSLPFTWGSHDCCSFAAASVLELTGVDHFAPFVGQYDSAISAARVLKEHDGVRGIATAALGDEIPPLTAQRGDIVMISAEHGDTLSVCMGGYCLAPGDTCLTARPILSAVTAWRVA